MGKRDMIKDANRKGMALVWTMLAMTLMVSTVLVGISLLEMTANVIEGEMQYHGQAPAIAKAGLFDGLAWFRRQTTQPVTTFAPQRDMMAVPIINDTDDPTIGIVREIDVDQSSNIYGRYEVISSTVTDISSQRGFTGAGTIWNIESIGYIYRKLDDTKAYNVWPNQVLAHNILAVDIRRVSMVLPGQAAVCAGDPAQTIFGNNSRVIGGVKYASVYPPGTAPTILGGAVVTGTPTALSQLTPYNDEPEDVFGMTAAELRSIADYYVTSVADLPVPIPSYKIVFFEGNPTFNSSTPLKGTGIFYCTGNLTIAAGSASSYNGIIYCVGNYQQNGTSVINGAIVAKDNVNIQGSGDKAEVNYDATILSQVQTYTGQYRFAKGFFLKK
ncbi:MAG: hypothetical protein AB1599_01915 [Planctomycetota bacterium]